MIEHHQQYSFTKSLCHYVIYFGHHVKKSHMLRDLLQYIFHQRPLMNRLESNWRFISRKYPSLKVTVLAGSMWSNWDGHVFLWESTSKVVKVQSFPNISPLVLQYFCLDVCLLMILKIIFQSCFFVVKSLRSHMFTPNIAEATTEPRAANTSDFTPPWTAAARRRGFRVSKNGI